MIAWGDGLVGVIEKQLHKGDAVLVTGQNKTRKWGEGRRHPLHDRGGHGPARHAEVRRRAAQRTRPKGQPSSGYVPDLNDEIPF